MKRYSYPRFKAQPSPPPFNDDEKAIVKRFGTKAQYIKYSRDPNLIGFRILGLQTGFEVEASLRGSLRWLRILTIDGFGNVWRTNRKFPLRRHESLHDLVPGLWKWVR